MILVFADQADGQLKKQSLEAMSYGAALAGKMGTTAEAVVLGTASADELAKLGTHGAAKVHHVATDSYNQFDAGAYTSAIADLAGKLGANVIVLSQTTSGKAVGPRLSARLKAGLVAGAVALPEITDGFTVKKSVFSGKAFAHVKVITDIKIISINPNSFGKQAVSAAAGEVITHDIPFQSSGVQVKDISKVTGSVPLSEAELVVSGGRGLKGPENWHLIEDLASALGAATACSRPVADAHWRPHHEHVGQTGGAIAPNLYIAVGISGAIQHLAGVNRSKNIVVINKDPEAPFFKAADYGIVGDAFDVLPKLTEAVKQLKQG